MNIMTGLTNLAHTKKEHSGGLDSELTPIFEAADSGASELFAVDMQFYDEKAKSKIQDTGSSSSNYQSAAALHLNSDKGMGNYLFEDLISIVESASNPSEITDIDKLNQNSSTILPGDEAHTGAGVSSGRSQGEMSRYTATATWGHNPSSIGGSWESLPGTSPPSRNASFLTETASVGGQQTEASSSSNQKKLFYSSLGYQSVPGLRLTEHRSSSSSSNISGKTSKSPVSGRQSCSPPVRTTTRRLSNSSTSPTRGVGGGRARRNSCDQKMSCSPSSSGAATAWGWPSQQQPLTTADRLAADRLAVDRIMTDRLTSDKVYNPVSHDRVPPIPGDCSAAAAATESAVPAYDDRSSYQRVPPPHPSSNAGQRVPPPHSSRDAASYDHSTIIEQADQFCSSMTISDACTHTSSTPATSSAPSLHLLTPPIQIRPENSILRKQLQGKLGSSYKNETVICKDCNKVLTVKCIMKTCLKSDEVLCEICNMELTVKCILKSCMNKSP